MAIKDWKRIKSKNPYETHIWKNTKKHLLLRIYYDIGFGKQRNVSLQDYTHKTIEGFEILKVWYLRNQKEALEIAKQYMERN